MTPPHETTATDENGRTLRTWAEIDLDAIARNARKDRKSVV